jgi:hypothetical protein
MPAHPTCNPHHVERTIAMPVNLVSVPKATRRKVDFPAPAAPRAAEPKPAMSLAVKLLIGAALVGFAILHFVGASMLQDTSSKQPAGAATHTRAAD